MKHDWYQLEKMWDEGKPVDEIASVMGLDAKTASASICHRREAYGGFKHRKNVSISSKLAKVQKKIDTLNKYLTGINYRLTLDIVPCDQANRKKAEITRLIAEIKTL